MHVDNKRQIGYVYITELTANVVVIYVKYGKMQYKKPCSSILPQTFEHDIESCESSSGSNNWKAVIQLNSFVAVSDSV